MHSSLPAPRFAASRFALGVPFLLLSVAYAKTPPPVEHMQAARQAIETAERVDAATLAAVELSEARAKLASATAAANDKEMLDAERLADEARAEAELAAARATVAKANVVNLNMKRSTATLVEEMQRKSGDNK